MKTMTVSQLLKILISDFRDSEIPKDRLFFLNSIRELIENGEKLEKLLPSSTTKLTIKMLKNEIKDYSLYPKLNNGNEQRDNSH